MSQFDILGNVDGGFPSEDRKAANGADSPYRDVLWGGAAAAAFVGILAGCALFAPFDAAVTAPGQIETSSARQAVQHREGGVVSGLYVHEGDHVVQGQAVVQLNADEINANERSTQAQVIELQALKARLTAELSGLGDVPAPPQFADLTGPDRDAANAALAMQRKQFRIRRAALSTGTSVLNQRSREAQEQISGVQRQIAANQQQQALLGQEITAVKGLMDKGLVPATRMRTLQRNAAELSGNEGQFTADVAKTQAEIAENRLRATDLVQEKAADNSKDLQTAQLQLGDLEPKLAALKAQADRSVVRAPATGKVMGLSVLTVGGVAAPGQLLMSVVPDGPGMVIQFKVKPADAGYIKIGGPANVRISALHDLGLPVLKATVTKLSPDSFADEKTGAAYFRAEATIAPSQLKSIEAQLQGRPILYPGLPVEVVVAARKRTAWEYFVEPFNRRLYTSFRQP